MNKELIKLKKRLIDISYKNKLSHIGSCLTALPIIFGIYSIKKKDDIFILSNGHAGLALYIILEHFYNINAEDLFHKHGVHPNRDLQNNIICSTGSLGSGLPIAIGHAIANKNIKIHCLISDGECSEGSIWESLKFISDKSIFNVKVYVNINGFTAFDSINSLQLENKLKIFLPTINCFFVSSNFLDINGIDCHYKVLNEEEHKKLSEIYA